VICITVGANESLGSVGALWRYPVKSMMGEELNASAVGKRGLVGDRVYAIVDPETRKVASAKHITRSDDADFDQTISAMLGRSGKLQMGRL
jgi:hypothetical protein